MVAVATQHLFFYAAESSENPYYITEKVFHGLLAGSVPVDLGDSLHLKQIAPPHSIIYADDFETVEALATHLMKDAKDQALYESYLQWRDQPKSNNPPHHGTAPVGIRTFARICLRSV